MERPFSIPSTLEVIIRCWQNAERELRKNIEQKHHDLGEPFITRLFLGELAFELRERSKERCIEQAFLNDLQQAYPELDRAEFTNIAVGLVADVPLHEGKSEGSTGGDFGLILTYPQVFLASPSTRVLRYGYLYIEEYQRGLLCQAKLKGRNGKWGQLSKRQQEIFERYPKRMEYLALLLYQYADSAGKPRRKLQTFAWQLCRNASVQDVVMWLKSGHFPKVRDSAEILRCLGRAKIGTDDKETLEQIIQSTKRPLFHIKIFWPPDKRPPGSVTVRLRQVQGPKFTERDEEVESQRIGFHLG